MTYPVYCVAYYDISCELCNCTMAYPMYTAHTGVLSKQTIPVYCVLCITQYTCTGTVYYTVYCLLRPILCTVYYNLSCVLCTTTYLVYCVLRPILCTVYYRLSCVLCTTAYLEYYVLKPILSTMYYSLS